MKVFRYIVLFLFSAPFLFKIYMQRIGAFGCFDDCSIYITAFFMNEGKKIYEEIFFNHQMLMPFISLFIQKYLHPESIYQLVLFHRLFIFLFSVLANSLLILRFGKVGLFFALLYEFTKFYLFGDRFLPEAVIVYPFVYLIGLLWYVFTDKTVYRFDMIIAALATWFIVFMREPYVPAGIVIFSFLLLKTRVTRTRLMSLFLFFCLSLIVLALVPFEAYIFNVFTVNTIPELGANSILNLQNILKIFGYPVYLLVDGTWNHFRIILLGLNMLFMVGIVLSYPRKRKGRIIVLLVILGVANLRYVPPGKIFYEAFHMLPWYSMFVMLVALFTIDIAKSQKKILGVLLYSFLTVLFLFIIFSPQSFIQEKVDSNGEFTVGFGQYYSYGQVVRILADSNDSLFLDGFDDLIYWQAKIYSSYKYAWYTSVMSHFQKYREARTEMFIKNPPDFYYGSCIKNLDEYHIIPYFLKDSYIRLYFSGKPSCLSIHKKKLKSISAEQLIQAEKLGYYLQAPNF